MEYTNMTVVEALNLARAAGINFWIDGDDLVLQATKASPSEMLDQLRTHKAEILAFLRLSLDGWSARGWQASFEERA